MTTDARHTQAATVDEYIAGCAQAVRPILRKLRTTIRRAVPQATECIRYRMPAYKFNGDLMYFAAFKRHIGVFPPVRGTAALMKAVRPYVGPKGNLRFALAKPIPFALVARCAKQRANFNQRRIANKASKTSHVDVTVDAASLETDFPDPLKVDFNAQLRGPQWLNVEKHPTMIFRSTRVVLTGEQKFRIEGELTLRGVIKPVSLEAKYNGGYAGHPMDPNARVGFSARGHLKRSEFGLAVGIPAPGTTMGVGDDVEMIIEAEFTSPPLAAGPTNGH